MTHIRYMIQYNTLEDIARARAEVFEKRQAKGEQVTKMLDDLTAAQKPNTRREMVTNIIGEAVMVFDVYMTIRKLTKQYGSLFSIFRKKKKKK